MGIRVIIRQPTGASLSLATMLICSVIPNQSILRFLIPLTSCIAFTTQAWEKQFSAAGVGGFFAPCNYLKDRAASGQELSAGMSASSKL